MAYLHGTFKTIQNDTIEVRIKSNNSNSPEYLIGDEYDSEIHFGADPVIINVSLDDMFDTIIQKSCTISLESSIFLGDLLYAPQMDSTTVKVYKNNVLIYDGFVEPNTYNQAWAHKYDSYELSCVDNLALFKDRYWTDSTSYSNLTNDANIYSFKQLLQKLGLGSSNVFFDQSVNLNNNAAFDNLGVSLNVFLGESEADIMSYDAILDSILKFLNLHIIQEGSDYYIFNWDSIINNTANWTALFGSGTPLIDLTNISVVKANYTDDSTNISVDEVYNQIKVRANFKAQKDAVPDPFDDGSLTDIFNGNPELCITEAWYDESKHRREFGEYIKSQMFTDPDSITVNASGDKWHAKDWYMKVQKNNKWNLYWHDTPVTDFITYNGTTPNYQSKILKELYDHKFMPMLISIGSGKEIKNGALTRRSEVTTNRYLVISSCGGWTTKNENWGDRQFNDKATLLAAIDNARTYASGTLGLFSFDSGSAIAVSPKEDDETNFLVIQGTIRLEPHHYKSGTGTVAPIVRSGENAAFGDIYNYVNTVESKYWLGSTWACKNDGTIGYYQQIPWIAQTPTSAHTPVHTQNENYLSPPVSTHGIGINYYQDRFTYNKSKTPDGWSNDDIINKIPILECELKIGNKYCVEDIVHLDVEGCPTYHWLTAEECTQQGYPNKSITLGFNPTIGEFIMGKDYEFTNTADGRIMSKKGMAIPIKKSDVLTGPVSFKIKGVLNVDWNVYVDYEGSFLGGGMHIEGSQNVWKNVASIWIKDFHIIFDSDNGAEASTKTNNSDIMYMSDEQRAYTKKKEDLTFNLITPLSNAEVSQYGFNTAISYSNVINLMTNAGVETITEPNGTDKAEKLYIDQYYNYYYTPKIIVNTQIRDAGYTMLNTFTYNGFGKTLPLSLQHNLHNGTMNISSRQV